MLEPTQEHQHLPSLRITPNMVEVHMSNVTHYKKLERRHCETITKEHFCSMIVLLKNSYKLRDYLATDRMKHFEYTYK